MFAAVFPPAAVIEELEEYIAPRRESDRRLSWVWPEQWHLTTVFVDDCPERSLEPLLESLGALAARTPAFDVRLAGGGAFPDPFTTRVLYLGVTSGEESLRALTKHGRAAASTVGAAPDGTRFVPHLTLARTRTRFDATRWLGVLDSFGGFDWRAGELTVIRSHLRQGPRNRSRYEVLAELPFAGVGTPQQPDSSHDEWKSGILPRW